MDRRARGRVVQFAHAGNTGMVSRWRAASVADATRRWLVESCGVELLERRVREYLLRSPVSQTVQSGSRVDRAIESAGCQVRAMRNSWHQGLNQQNDYDKHQDDVNIADEGSSLHASIDRSPQKNSRQEYRQRDEEIACHVRDPQPR